MTKDNEMCSCIKYQGHNIIDGICQGCEKQVHSSELYLARKKPVERNFTVEEIHEIVGKISSVQDWLNGYIDTVKIDKNPKTMIKLLKIFLLLKKQMETK